MEMTEMTFTAACRRFFGFKPGGGAGELIKEMHALDTSDREYFTREFEKIGIRVVASKAA